MLRYDKAVETLLYIASKGSFRKRNILAIIYFTDRERIAAVGSTMYGESYKAGGTGSIPIAAYSILERGDRGRGYFGSPRIPLVVEDEVVRPLREPDMGLLSKVDVKLLDETASVYGLMKDEELTARFARMPDYAQAEPGEMISFGRLVASVDREKGARVGEYLASI